MRATFIIPGKLPSLNDIINASRTHFHAANTQKKKAQKFIGEHIAISQVPNFKEPVIIAFEWTEPNRTRDLDNVCAGGRKFILDALVECEILENDSRKFVKGFVDQFPDPDKINPHIEVTIETLSHPSNGQNGGAD